MKLKESRASARKNKLSVAEAQRNISAAAAAAAESKNNRQTGLIS
jgi:hypothetical protein